MWVVDSSEEIESHELKSRDGICSGSGGFRKSEAQELAWAKRLLCRNGPEAHCL